MTTARQPTFYLPHGGGPCFFMDDPSGMWTGMRTFLESVPSRLPERPKAILVVSGHWETDGFALTSAAHPSLYYDYSNFPPHTYELRYDAPGDPALAEQAAGLLKAAGLPARIDTERGLDHGVFVPLKVAFPDASIPVVELSLDRSLDPALHLAAGRALAPLRDQGVLIVATGMSFHNMRSRGDPRLAAASDNFDAWLTETVAAGSETRNAGLQRWEAAPDARLCHPDEEHLVPLMVAAGAADGASQKIYAEHLMNTALSGFSFD